jgi:hypothetical protein
MATKSRHLPYMYRSKENDLFPLTEQLNGDANVGFSVRLDVFPGPYEVDDLLPPLGERIGRNKRGQGWSFLK